LKLLGRKKLRKKKKKHVQLIGAIYVELFVSCAPIVEDFRIFEQEQKSKELEEELEVALNF
jgi:hypothetical protein